MEEHFPTCPPDPPPEAPCDPEVFARVWRRVMPGDRPDCPFRLPGGAETAEEAPAPGEVPPCAALAVPAPRLPAAPDEGDDVPCLGAASAVHGGLLQACIARALEDWRCYRLLSRRAPGSGSGALAALAADEHRHAKRLAAAYFLISGVRYWPAARPANAAPAPYPAALRERFRAEQRGELAYRAAAEETEDPALRALFLELAREEASHARTLRALVEQL